MSKGRAVAQFLRECLKEQHGQIGIYVVLTLLVSIVLLAFLPAINIGTVSNNVNAATNYLEGNGYVVLDAGEYAAIIALLTDIDAKADAAVVNAEAAEIAAIAARDTAAVQAALVLADLHTMQYIYPILALPVTLPAEGNPWTYGALTEIIPANTITSDFVLHDISISGMSANANYVIRITYGAGDVEWSFATITRSGVQAASAIIPVQGIVIPANSVIKAQIADSIGTSTLGIKIMYHIEST